MSASSEYVGFSENQRKAVRGAVAWARFLLDQVGSDLRVLYRSARLPSTVRIKHFLNRDVETILKNNFDIDVYAEDRFLTMGRLKMVRDNFQTLRSEIARPFPKVLSHRHTSGHAEAFVSGPSPNKLAPMYFLPDFFRAPRLDQAALVVHELAHQKLQLAHHADHPGMGTDATGAGLKPHENKQDTLGGRHFFHNAIKNPYCYQWFCLAVSPQYNPSRYGGTLILPGLSVTGG